MPSLTFALTFFVGAVSTAMLIIIMQKKLMILKDRMGFELKAAGNAVSFYLRMAILIAASYGGLLLIEACY